MSTLLSIYIQNKQIWVRLEHVWVIIRERTLGVIKTDVYYCNAQRLTSRGHRRKSQRESLFAALFEKGSLLSDVE